MVDDAPTKIEVDGRQFEWHVVSVQGSEVAVGIKHDFGETEPIREARLIIDLSFLLEALRNRYQEVLNGRRDLDTRVAQQLFGSAPVTSGIDPDELYLPPSPHPPNDEQITAIRAACGSDIHFIWGPPGTGKTDQRLDYSTEGAIDNRRQCQLFGVHVGAQRHFASRLGRDSPPRRSCGGLARNTEWVFLFRV